MPAIIDDDLTLFSALGDWETDPILSVDPAGFDSVKATICYRGTALELFDLYALGKKNCPEMSSKALYYCGPRVIEARFGYQIAELEWKGFASDPWTNSPVAQLLPEAYVRSVNLTMTTDESQWPREVNGNTLYLESPYAPGASVGGANGLREFSAISPAGAAITTGYLPWRVRLIGRAWSVAITGIIAGKRSGIIKPPKCIVPNPVLTSGGQLLINWLNTGDPTVTWADETQGQDGWVCRNYDLSSELALGDVTLARWTANYQWVPRYGA